MDKKHTHITQKHAYVTLVMKNQSYIIGAMVLAYSLKVSKTNKDIICMITKDITKQNRKLLKQIFDKVIVVNYIELPEKKLFSNKQEKIYSSWKNFSYTKWNCLQLEDYSKVCFLDADLLILQNIDHIFNLEAPAGSFKNYWLDNSRFDIYKNIPYGDVIPHTHIKKSLERGFVLCGHCVLLSPSKQKFINFQKFLKTFKTQPRCISMVDEQAIVSFLQNETWRQLTFSYNTIPWHIEKTNITNKVFHKPYILHYFNKDKPWTGEGEWQDEKIWWGFCNNMKKKYHVLHESPEIEIESNTCQFCVFLKGKNIKTNYGIDHKMIYYDTIICPILNIQKQEFSQE